MRRFLVLTTFENNDNGHQWAEFSLHEHKKDALAKQVSILEASMLSTVKVKSSVVLKVKEVG